MRIDLSDLDRLTGIAEALERLFWCLIAVAFLAAVLGSHGTGLLLLILGAAAFVARTGLEDFVRARGQAAPKKVATPKPKKAATPRKAAGAKRTAAPKKAAAPKPKKAPAKPTADPEFTVHRAQRRPRRTKSAA
ncbi:MAG TPA: hypothetical protein VHZ54_07320 [Solirubrobacterales bacterium]|jgi:hypothetical protein|nr:hypothetical protein [Solirubrobacterales bacterium]